MIRINRTEGKKKRSFKSLLAMGILASSLLISSITASALTLESLSISKIQYQPLQEEVITNPKMLDMIKLGSDLIPTNFDAPTIAYPGQSIGMNMTLNAKNIGFTSAVSNTGYFFVGFYLSKDTTLDRGDTLLKGGRESVKTPLLPNQSKPVSIYDGMSIPTTISTGNYYLLAKVDEFDYVKNEIRETNNVAVRKIRIVPNAPDLIPTNFTAPTIAFPGEKIGMNMTLDSKNIGFKSAVSDKGYFFVGFYLSKDTVLDSTDKLLLGGRESVQTPLLPNQTKHVSIYDGMSIPVGTTTGYYYLLAKVDEFDYVKNEIRETNNVAVRKIRIVENAPDLIPTNFTAPSTAYPGQKIGMDMTLDTKNIGVSTAQSDRGYFFVGFYLSKDTVLDSTDRLLIGGREAVYTPLLPNQKKSVSIYDGMYVPYDTSSGYYYLIAKVDEFDYVKNELSETNNVAVKRIQIK